MSTVPTLQIESTKPEDTFAAGQKLGETLQGGEVVQLVGDLGAGKTQFIRGLAAGLGSEDEVASPSFTISREYMCRNDITLHHFDFYRLDEPGILEAELQELIGDEYAVVAIEWGDIVEAVLPESHITVKLTATDEAKRTITIQLPEQSA